MVSRPASVDQSSPRLAAPSSGPVRAPRARLRPHDSGAGQQAAWGDALLPAMRAADLAEWSIGGLSAGTGYDYQLSVQTTTGETALSQGTVPTQRPAGQPFTFALVTDTHIGSDLTYTNRGAPRPQGAAGPA